MSCTISFEAKRRREDIAYKIKMKINLKKKKKKKKINKQIKKNCIYKEKER